MVMRCCVSGCKKYGIRMHTFPLNLEIRKRWLVAIGREDLLELNAQRLRKSYRVCTLHFAADCKYSDKFKQQNIKRTAEPTLYLPTAETKVDEPKDDEETVNFNNVCRACLSTENKLIDLDSKLIGNLNVLDIFNQYLLIKIKEDDDLPQQICTSCLFELSRVYLFINNCREADSKLRELVELAEEEDLYTNLVAIDAAPTEDDVMADSDDFDEETEEIENNEETENIEEMQNNAETENEEMENKGDTENNEDTENGDIEFIFINEIEKQNTESNEKDISKFYKLGPIKVEEPGPPFICNNCSMEFKTLKSLKEHRTLKRHYIVQQYKCRYCTPSKIYTYRLWKSHMRVHTGEKPFTCHVCGKKFSARANMQRHIFTHTGEKRYHCEICNKGFTQSTTMKAHMLSKHNVDKDNEIKGEYVCKICKDIFDTKAKFDSHTLNHYGSKYVCGPCGKCFNFKSILEKHMETHKVQEFKCGTCNKVFAKSSFLKMHQRIHTGVKPFECIPCGKCFLQKAHLKTHMKTHTGERPYICDFCGKSFALNGNLKVHMRQHTGEYTHKCEYCGKGFIDSSRVKYHQKKCENALILGPLL